MVKRTSPGGPTRRRRIDASEFKSHCLQLLDHVQHSGEELEITHGRVGLLGSPDVVLAELESHPRIAILPIS